MRSDPIWTSRSENATPGRVVMTPYSRIRTVLPSFSRTAKPVVAVHGSSQRIIMKRLYGKYHFEETFSSGFIDHHFSDSLGITIVHLGLMTLTSENLTFHEFCKWNKEFIRNKNIQNMRILILPKRNEIS